MVLDTRMLEIGGNMVGSEIFGILYVRIMFSFLIIRIFFLRLIYNQGSLEIYFQFFLNKPKWNLCCQNRCRTSTKGARTGSQKKHIYIILNIK